jgi:hypothetical protein
VASLKDGGKIVNNSYIMYADETVISIRRIWTYEHHNKWAASVDVEPGTPSKQSYPLKSKEGSKFWK